MTGITVKDLARWVSRPAEDQGVVIARLRNWTKEGLLSPVGEPNPGTGRARLYDDGAILRALVLTALSDLGVPAIRSKQLSSGEAPFFQLVEFGFGQIADLERRGAQKDVLLIFNSNPLSTHRAAIIEADRTDRKLHIQLPQSLDACVVLNLSAMLRDVRKRVDRSFMTQEAFSG